MCALKNIRIWFKKDFECRYISHLDLNRTMLRALHKSRIPIWHTEGFNPHPFATFPLPLSLGFRGINECMDVKLEDDDYPFEAIIEKLNCCLPRGMRVFSVTEPVVKAGQIAFASFCIRLSLDKKPSSLICAQLRELLGRNEILIEKRSKKGMKTVDIKAGVKSFSITEKFDFARLDVVLSAGSSDNVNPNLLITALEQATGEEYEADVTRVDLYNAEAQPFR